MTYKTPLEKQNATALFHLAKNESILIKLVQSLYSSGIEDKSMDKDIFDRLDFLEQEFSNRLDALEEKLSALEKKTTKTDITQRPTQDHISLAMRVYRKYKEKPAINAQWLVCWVHDCVESIAKNRGCTTQKIYREIIKDFPRAFPEYTPSYCAVIEKGGFRKEHILLQTDLAIPYLAMVSQRLFDNPRSVRF